MKVRFFRLSLNRRTSKVDTKLVLALSTLSTEVEEIEDNTSHLDEDEDENRNELDIPQGNVRFDLENICYYNDNLRKIDSPIEWSQCWYHSDTLKHFRLEAAAEAAEAAANSVQPNLTDIMDSLQRKQKSSLKNTSKYN
eukprot:CAMPEP_0198138426 /NCGR_PEP_ID=MMETSP1443-20131203/1846_1 /TAXON_ID=186043 /ORGANISM="Entomoneis sp., Strain CCMP2396" /LENGTH=138 /DNA_ID=CAMNT_0043800205 /DNA_START=10 /DNA_END=426 /DNA_ORIENTATION=+